MKKVTELLESATSQQQTTTTASSRKLLPEQWVVGIFKKMQLRYGQLWTSRLQAHDKDLKAVIREWQETLSNCTGEQIRKGLDTWDSEFPPNVMQFRTRCLRDDEHWQQRSSPAYKIYQRERLLPDKSAKERSRAAMKAALQEIRGK